MKRQLLTVFILILSLTFLSCYGSWNPFYEGNDVDHRADSILEISNEKDSVFKASGVSELSGNYNVLVLTDLHFGAAAGNPPFDLLYEWLDSVKNTPEKPAFVLSLGDSADVGKKSQYEEYDEFCRKLLKNYDLKIIFNTCGNHDLYQGHWDNWKESCYPNTSFYTFQTKGFSWYGLDTASGKIGPEQYEALLKEFSDDPKPKIIFTHYPLTEFRVFGIGLDETTERNLLIDTLYNNQVKTYMAGHNHYIRSDFIGFDAYCCPSFHYNRSWGVLHVNENTGSAKIEFIP